MATDQTTLFLKEMADKFFSYMGQNVPAEMASLCTMHSPTNCQAFQLPYLDERSLTDITSEPSAQTSTAQGFQDRWMFKIFSSDTWHSNVTSQNQSALLKSMLPGVVEKQSRAVKRRLFKLLLTQLVGTAKTGASGGTDTALPATQKIAKDYVASGTAADSGLTLEKLDKAKVMLEEDPLYDPSDELILLVTPTQAQSLLTLIRGTNAVDRAYIEQNTLKYINGMKLVKTTDLDLTSSVRTCIAYNKKAAAAAVWGDENTFKVEQLQANHYRWQAYARVGIGATRIHEKGVVSIACKEG